MILEAVKRESKKIYIYMCVCVCVCVLFSILIEFLRSIEKTGEAAC